MKANLSEIIFEIRWGKQAPVIDKGEITNSPDYNILLGQFLENFRREYTALETLPSAGMPEGISRGIVQYRLRKSKIESFPLVQFGPGIFSVNTSIDNWNSFNKLVIEATNKFNKFTLKNGLEDIKLSITNIYAQEFDFEKENLTKFIQEQLGINVALNKNRNLSDLKSFSFQFKVSNSNPKGEITYIAGEGKKNNKSAVVWQSKIQSDFSKCPTGEGLTKWLRDANEIVRKWVIS
jgi:hypothetical protein